MILLGFCSDLAGAAELSGDSRSPEIRKAGRLGNDRPSLGARLGVGLSKPWGVWEGGFDERPGSRRRAIGNLGSWVARRLESAAGVDAKCLSDKIYK